MPGYIIFVTLTVGYDFGWRDDHEIRRNKVVTCREG